jgi:hypothetical protein
MKNIKEAGTCYGISPTLLKAISDVESNGNIHAVHYNPLSRPTDVGHMQINSFWQQFLGEHYKTLFDACYCTMVGAWILKQCIDRYGYNWNAVACYHTGYGLSDAKSSIMSIFAGIYYESVIRRYFPAYSAILFVSGIVCVTGLVYALIMRNVFIALLTIIGTAAIPWLVNWFMAYWPFVAQRVIFFGE